MEVWGPPSTGLEMDADDSGHHEELLAALGRGSDSALGELYDWFERPLYALGVRILKDRQRAEELVQDTIVKVWRGASGFDASKGTASAWIFTIARRSAVDIVRKERRNPLPVDTSLHDAAGEDDGDAAWRAWEIGLALAGLPEEQRRVVELSVIQGYTHVEIADAFDVPLGTVKTRIYAGLRRLREHLEKLEILEART
jgi:RNA polymerase sigma factor (sigma-70 family)